MEEDEEFRRWVSARREERTYKSLGEYVRDFIVLALVIVILLFLSELLR